VKSRTARSNFGSAFSLLGDQTLVNYQNNRPMQGT
jgi:hypothetical protein